MSNIPYTPSPEISLSLLYPDSTKKMYDSCQKAAEDHTGADSLFGGLTTNVDKYPLQDVDCQFVPAKGDPIETVIEFGNYLFPGISSQSEEFLTQNIEQITNVYEALKAGYNVAVAVPTHDQVHDLAPPLGQLSMGLKMKHGYDEPDDRLEIFAKSLAWYDFMGEPVPKLAQMIGHTVLTLPHSRSGDKFDNRLRDEFNQRALVQMWEHLDQGSKLFAVATSGATNYTVKLDNKVILAFQPPIHSGTARLLNNERNLTLPIACNLAKDHSYTSTIGELVDLKTEEDCFQVGVWAAEEYRKLSGTYTIQLRTRGQLEALVKAKAEDIAEAVQSSTFGQWLAEKTKFNQ